MLEQALGCPLHRLCETGDLGLRGITALRVVLGFGKFAHAVPVLLALAPVDVPVLVAFPREQRQPSLEGKIEY